MFRSTESNQGNMCPAKIEAFGHDELVTGGGFDDFPAEELTCGKDCTLSTMKIGGIAIPLTARVDCELFEGGNTNPGVKGSSESIA